MAALDDETAWSEGQTLELTLPPGSTVREWVLEEEIVAGQRVQRYQIEIRRGGRWKPQCEGESIGRRRIMTLPAPITAETARLRIRQSLPLPRIRRFAAY